MVNILPSNPTFGTLLAQALGNAGQNIGAGLTERSKLLSKKNLIESYGKNFSGSSLQNQNNEDLDQKINSFKKEFSIPSQNENISEEIPQDSENLQNPESHNFIKEALTFQKPPLPFAPTDISDFSKIAQMQQKERLSNEKNAQKKIDSIDESAKGSQRQLDSIRVQKKIISEGKGGPLSWDNLMSKLGFRTWMSPSGQLFQSQMLNYMEGMRDLFGVRLTDADLKLVLDKLPDIGRDPKSNKQIMDFFEIGAQYNIARKNAKDLILSEAEKQGVFPKDLDRRIDLVMKETFSPYREQMIQNIENLAQESKSKTPLPKKDFPKGTIRTNNKTGQSQVWNGSKWMDRK